MLIVSISSSSAFEVITVSMASARRLFVPESDVDIVRCEQEGEAVIVSPLPTLSTLISSHFKLCSELYCFSIEAGSRFP